MCVVVCVGVAAFVCDGACVARRVGGVCVSRWVSGFCMCVEAGAVCVVRALFFPLTCIYLYILYLYILKGGSVCMGAGVLCLYPERWVSNSFNLDLRCFCFASFRVVVS